MRIGELLETRWDDVDFTDKIIQIHEAQKNRRGRVVYISTDACQTLAAWQNESKGHKGQYLFVGQKKTPHLCYEAARAVFRKILVKAQLAGKGYTLHCLRHTFASEMLNAGMPLQCLQELLGHRNIEITRRYARLTDTTRKQAYFAAMAVIEKGGLSGHYRCGHRVPAVS